MGTSRLFGTMAVSTSSPERRTNFTWLPFWLTSMKPADSSRRLISRKGCGLSRPNLNLDSANLGWPSRLWCFEVELQCLFHITLAGDIQLQALRNIPIAFAPNGSGERSLRDDILSQPAVIKLSGHAARGTILERCRPNLGRHRRRYLRIVPADVSERPARIGPGVCASLPSVGSLQRRLHSILSE